MTTSANADATGTSAAGRSDSSPNFESGNASGSLESEAMEVRVLSLEGNAFRVAKTTVEAAPLLGDDGKFSTSARAEQVDFGEIAGLFRVPASLRNQPPLLVVTDVDSTLIEEEVIDQLAAEAGVGEQVAEITSAAMRGELDFAESLHERVATLKGLDEGAFARVLSRLHVTAGARELVEWVHRQGGLFGVVSGGFTQIVEPLAKSLGIDFTLAITLEVAAGKLTGQAASPVVTAQSKVEALREWATLAAQHAGIADEDAAPSFDPVSRTVAVGDGANDIPMLLEAALGVAFCAKPKVQKAAPSQLQVRRLDAIAAALS